MRHKSKMRGEVSFNFFPKMLVASFGRRKEESPRRVVEVSDIFFFLSTDRKQRCTLKECGREL